jgi:hypothetical protein
VPDPWLPLELEGHGGRSLPCLLHTSGDEVGIAVVLPGNSLYGGRLGGTGAGHSLEVADPADSARLLAGVLDEPRAYLGPVAAAAVGSR